ncbi:MAG: trehalose-phosphatase [Myxococcales bacterium]
MMEPLLSSRVLSTLGTAEVLLAFDFDGTLAPIVDDPSSAAMRTTTRHLLAQVAQVYPCAVISGRTEQEVMRLLGGVTVWYVIGNRFLEAPEVVERRCREVQSWLPLVQRELTGLEGISIEDKGASLAIHYRHAVDRDRAREAIGNVARLLESARAVAGKEVVNLLPAGANKGAAVDRVRRQLGCEVAIYVGDDGTDEDVFAAGPSVLGVRVGPAADSAARYCLRDQGQVDELLERLLSLRAPRATLRESSRHGRAAGRARDLGLE